MKEYCSFCGRHNPPYEHHHVSGFINHPFWTARACIDCHQIVSAWQYARRTPLSKEYVPPSNVKAQAIHEGLTAAYEVASEYAGESPSSIAAGTIITRLLKHDAHYAAGKTFSLDGDYPKLQSKQPIRVPESCMNGHNFQRVLAAMCDMMAFIAEESEEMSKLARLLREIAKQLPFKWPASIPKGDFLMALGTADESVIKDKLSKFAAELGVQL